MKNIKQQVSFNCSPDILYKIIMDSKLHSKITGGKASVSQKEGGKFSVYDGYATGKNIKLVENKIIVQSWRASNWQENHFSTITFEIKKIKGGTRLVFSQKNIPDEEVLSIKKGWIDFYWNPIKSYLKDQK